MNSSEVKWTRLRLAVVFAFFTLACAGVLWRAFDLQVLQRDHLADIAERECYRTIELRPIRGDLFDRNGEKLAVSLEVDSIFAQPLKIKDPRLAAEKLARVLGVNKKELTEKLTKKSNFVWLRRLVGPETVEQVRALDISGLAFIKEGKRFYPNKTLASHLLGFVGLDSRGLEGVELGCNEELQGDVNEWRVRRDALGRIFLDRQTGPPQIARGENVFLTIDRRIQYVAEKALAAAVLKFKAKGGMVLVLRPRTGEILASAVEPTFNPNVYGKYPASVRRNRILTDSFDPGSTFKVFIVAAALEEGLVRPEEKIFCENGMLKIGGRRVHDHKKYGWLTVSHVIKKSSNIGTVKIGEKLGPRMMHRYLTRFSFGRKTGIDFPGEVSGLLRPYEKWHVLDAANVSFGQGISVTALQLTAAMAALANDGLLMRPFVVSRVVDGAGRVVKNARPEALRQVVSPRTAAEVRAMLREVVLEGGTGVNAEPKGYRAAGKTGTAQKLDLETMSYSDEKYFSSFLGFVPYENPELAIFAALDEPETKTYGGTVAAPIFREIAEKALPLLNIPPTKKEETGLLTAENESGASGKEKPGDHGSPGETSAEADSPKKPPRPALQAGVMPDLAGMSMRRVMDLMALFDVNCNFEGSGQAVWQQPPPGQRLQSGQVCQVRFEPW